MTLAVDEECEDLRAQERGVLCPTGYGFHRLVPRRTPCFMPSLLMS